MRPGEDTDKAPSGRMAGWWITITSWSRNGLSREEKIRCLGVIVLVGFLSAVLLHNLPGLLRRLPYPHSTFLFLPGDRFNDFYNMYNLCVHRNPYFETYFIKSNYYPFANVVFYLLTFLPKRVAFALFSGTFIWALYAINTVNLRLERPKDARLPLLALTFLTYPFLFTVDRGNIEGMLFLLLYWFLQKKDDHPVMSAALLGSAIAMKVYPAVFLVLLWSEKKYRQSVLTILVTLLITVGSLLVLRGGFHENLGFILSGFALNNKVFLPDNNLLLAGVSLFSVLKYLLHSAGTALPQGLEGLGLLRAYSVTVLAVFGFMSLYIVRIERVLWKKVALLVFAMLLFPHVSFDYKLISLFLPIYLFIKEAQPSRSDLLYAAAFGLLLIPKNYVFLSFFTFTGVTNDVGIDTLLNPMIMIGMLAWIMVEGFRSKSRSRAMCLASSRQQC